MPAIRKKSKYLNKPVSDHKTYVHLFDGVRQDWFAVASIIENTLMTIKKQMPNIEEVFLRSDNAEFEDGDILVWNSYNIGIGKKFKVILLRQEQGETGLNVINDFSEPRATYGAIKSKDTSTTANHQESEIFECPEPGCCATFSSFHDIETHQSSGRHLTNRLSTYDKVRKRWIETCNANFQNTINISNMSDTGTEGNSSEDMGWALRKERKFVRFSTEVKDFLKQEFEAGEISGKKSNPVTTSINMRTKVDEHGVRVFKADQFLQPSQIASFFARLSVMSKKTAPQQSTLDLPEENDDDLFNIIRN
ncbi:unnamed protein product [Mytilus coruscus]|uniref:C2H2-type domain-containing protein n=1 Tax=Mytilus coruscus TaxID=42192 RepID=A0A6J8A8F2_MYTCO|nr:unnamed protein product [Mytilus coruscus]